MPEVLSTSDSRPVDPDCWKRWLGFGLIIFLFILLGYSSFRDLGELYLAEPDYSHGFLIAPVALYLAYRRRRRFVDGGSDLSGWSGDGFPSGRNRARQAGVWGALFVTGVGTAVVTFGQWYDAVFMPMTALYLTISGFGLILCLLGLVWTSWGWVNCRVVLFPALYLVFALPLPPQTMSELTLSLQRLSSWLAAGSLQAVGIPVLREGNVLNLPEGAIGVAAACSGIRSLWCLLALAVALADIRLLRLWKSTLLVALVPLLAVGGNLVRLFVTGLLVARGRSDLATGTYHEALGMLTILLPGAAIFGLAGILGRKSEEQKNSASLQGATIVSSGSGPGVQIQSESRVEAVGRTYHRGIGVVLTAGILVAGAGVSGVVRHHYLGLYRSMVNQEAATLAQRKRLAEFPDAIGGYRTLTQHELSDLEMNALAMNDHVKRTYAKAGERDVGLTLMFWNPRQVDMPRWPVLFPHTADACYPGAGWRRDPKRDEDLRAVWLPDADLCIRVFSRWEREHLVLYWHSETHGSGAPGVLGRLKTMFTSWDSPPSPHLRSQYSVKIDVDVEGGDVDRARETALHFASLVAPLLWEYGIGERN